MVTLLRLSTARWHALVSNATKGNIDTDTYNDSFKDTDSDVVFFRKSRLKVKKFKKTIEITGNGVKAKKGFNQL